MSIINNTKTINLSGSNPFNFETHVNVVAGNVDILKTGITHSQGNAYATNTTFINA